MIILDFLLNLLLTIAIECGITLLFCRNRAQLIGCALGNLLTNPALNLTLLLTVTYAGASYYYPMLIVLELIAVVLECLTYCGVARMALGRAMVVSLFLNAASFAIGLILR